MCEIDAPNFHIERNARDAKRALVFLDYTHGLPQPG